MGRADDDPTTPSSPDPSQVSPVRSSATLTAPSTQEPLGHDDVTAILPHRFRRMETLGRGGAGVVVAAHDTVLRRDVAIKFLHHLGEADIRLLEEARAAADLHHKSIVTIYDVDPQGRYIVMELVHGQTLQQRLQQRRTLSVPEIYTLGRTLLDALQAAHARGIIHRDVKPANILFDRENVIKLNDFGIAFRTNSDETPQIAGTPAYMAPEVWEIGRASCRERVSVLV